MLSFVALCVCVYAGEEGGEGETGTQHMAQQQS